MSNKIQVFDLSNASKFFFTSTGFNKENDTRKNLCKITDAIIVFVGDNSKFETDKKKLFNTFSITLPKEQSEELLSLTTKIADKDKKPITIHLKDVFCTALRDYMDATIVIVVIGRARSSRTRTVRPSRTRFSRLPKSRSLKWIVSTMRFVVGRGWSSFPFHFGPRIKWKIVHAFPTLLQHCSPLRIE